MKPYLCQFALLLQMTALGLVLAVLFFPGAVFYGVLLLLLLAGWFPTDRWIKDAHIRQVRSFLLGLFVIFLFTSKDVELLLRAKGADEWSLLLPLAWMICLLGMREATPFGIPFGFLSCISLMSWVMPSTRLSFLALLLTVVFIFAAGACHFLCSLGRLSNGRNLVERLLGRRFVIHILMMLGATATTCGMARLFHIDLPPIIGASSRHASANAIASLNTTPPKLRGKFVCLINMLQNPFPEYLAEEFSMTYEKGEWRDLISTHAETPGYGTAPELYAPADIPGKCVIIMNDLHRLPPMPFGAFIGVYREDGAQTRKYAAADLGGVVGSIQWQKRCFVPPDSIPTACTTLPPELVLLRNEADRICAGASDDTAKIKAVTTYFMHDFIYCRDRDFRTPLHIDPIEHFLFTEKRGWCVHYATAAALLLRAAGVPTRFVLGFRVEPNGKKKVEVTDRDGHAWCEALIRGSAGSEWVIVDPCVGRIEHHTSWLARHTRYALGVTALLILGVVLLRTILRKDDTVSTARIAHDITAPEPARVAAMYQRVLLLLARRGRQRHHAETAREFARRDIPAYARDDLLTLTDAFERVKYMGYRRLGKFFPPVEAAYRRLTSGTNPSGKSNSDRR